MHGLFNNAEFKFCMTLEFASIYVILSAVLHPGSTNLRSCKTIVFNTEKIPEQSQDSGGIGRGGHFLSYKLIKRSFERETTFTNKFWTLAEDTRHPEAARLSERSAEKNIKDENRSKGFRDGDLSCMGRKSWMRKSFHTIGNPLTGPSVGSFEISEDKYN